MQVERGPRAVRRATVQIVKVTPAGTERRGQGLFLNLDGTGYVLTCHHVIASVTPAELHVRFPDENGELGPPLAAVYEDHLSVPSTDAAVLSTGPADPAGYANPLLHAPRDFVTFRGPWPVTGFGYTANGDTQRLHGEAMSALSLRIPVTRHATAASCCPDPPNGEYRVANALRVIGATGAAKGISGSVAECEGGVLGLIHFAIAHSPTSGRTNFVVPISVWAGGWPALAERIVPLMDRQVADEVNSAAASCLGQLRRLQLDPLPPWAVETPRTWLDEKWGLGEKFVRYRDTLRQHAHQDIYSDHEAVMAQVGDVRFLLERGDGAQVSTAAALLSRTLARYGWNNGDIIADLLDDYLLRLKGMRTALQREKESQPNGAMWRKVFDDEKYFLGQEFRFYRLEALWEHPDEQVFSRLKDVADMLWNKIVGGHANPGSDEVVTVIGKLEDTMSAFPRSAG